MMAAASERALRPRAPARDVLGRRARPAPRKPRRRSPPVEVPDESSDDENPRSHWISPASGTPSTFRRANRTMTRTNSDRRPTNEYVTYRNGRETPKSRFTIVQEHNHLKGRMTTKIHGPRGKDGYARRSKCRDNGDLHWDIQDSDSGYRGGTAASTAC